jgi:hypothetical protein
MAMNQTANTATSTASTLLIDWPGKWATGCEPSKGAAAIHRQTPTDAVVETSVRDRVRDAAIETGLIAAAVAPIGRDVLQESCHAFDAQRVKGMTGA